MQLVLAVWQYILTSHKIGHTWMSPLVLFCRLIFQPSGLHTNFDITDHTMPQEHSDMSSRIQQVINEFGDSPLGRTPLAKQPLTAAPDTILAMAMDAMVKSRPISHDFSQKTINHLIESGYHHLDKLCNSTWAERTAVLQDGGYSRYREQAAIYLGNLGKFVVNNYGIFIPANICETASKMMNDTNADRYLRRWRSQ